jgi:hypothetical protein
MFFIGVIIYIRTAVLQQVCMNQSRLAHTGAIFGMEGGMLARNAVPRTSQGLMFRISKLSTDNYKYIL